MASWAECAADARYITVAQAQQLDIFLNFWARIFHPETAA
jgi:hypothetical protein